MDARTVAVDSKDLESGIEALSNAGRAFRLTLFERGAYYALMVSVQVAAWGWLILIFLGVLAASGADVEQAGAIGGAVVALAAILAMVTLALNIPLAARLYRERARLKELGLASLSKSLWKETRRGRWISRVFRWAPAIVVVILTPLMFGDFILYGRELELNDNEIIAVLFSVVVVVLIVLSGYLRNQRERIELATSAEKLKKALQGLRQHAGESEVVSVPSELLEKAARIESAQIVKERKDAILQSIDNHSSGYSVTFDRDAATQRAALSVADRIELEDLVAQLSTKGPPQPDLDARATSHTSDGQRVHVEYKIERESQAIRIISVVRHEEGGVNA